MKELLRSSVFGFSVFLMFCSFGEVEMTKGVWKKIDKAIVNVWEEEEPQKTRIDLSKMSFEGMKMEGTESLLSISDAQNEIKGFLMISKAPSRYDNFDLMVLYDLNMAIVKSDILVYREDWGGEIASPRWLKQFIGKSSSDRIELNHGIQGISGATISCRSAVEEINRLTQMISHLNESGQLLPKN